MIGFSVYSMMDMHCQAYKLLLQNQMSQYNCPLSIRIRSYESIDNRHAVKYIFFLYITTQ